MFRLFVIGCSRSGTTIIQKHLSESMSLSTLPETDFFGIAGGGGRAAQLLSLAGAPRKRHLTALERLQDDLNAHSITIEVPHHAISITEAASRFTRALDSLAQHDGSLGWIEKTPKHFKHIHLIEKTVPDAHFVHVVREGTSVVASIVDRARRFPGRFKGQSNPEYAIRNWNKAIKATAANLHRTHHCAISYEEFCKQPKRAIDKLMKKFGMNTRRESWPEIKIDDKRIFRKKEEWKENTTNEINLSESKFNNTFSKQERTRIISRLDLETYHKILERIEFQT